MNKIEALENKIEQQQAKEKAKLEFPFKKGDKPYVLESYGDIRIFEIRKDIKSTGTVEFILYMSGCLFKNYVEAVEEFSRRCLLTKIKSFRDNCNGDWKPDFSIGTEYKWCIQKDVLGFVAEPVKQDVLNVFGYFKNEEDCIMALRLFEDEIKQLF